MTLLRLLVAVALFVWSVSGSASERVLTLPVEGGHEFVLLVPTGWDGSVSEPPGMQLPTVRLTPASEDVVLLLSFMPDQRGRSDAALLQAMVEERRAAMARLGGDAPDFESDMDLPLGGMGQLMLYKDAALAASDTLPPGEYVYSTNTVVVMDGVALLGTLLSHSTRSEAYRQGLMLLHGVGKH